MGGGSLLFGPINANLRVFLLPALVTKAEEVDESSLEPGADTNYAGEPGYVGHLAILPCVL